MFRRCVDQAGMDPWEQLITLIKQYPLLDDIDTPIWSLEPNGIYSVKSFYTQINFSGIASAISEKMWKILCPQKIHAFLCLCSYNKILTRDNLAKRRQVDDPSCLFCAKK